MLDDLKALHARDSQDLIDGACKVPQPLVDEVCGRLGVDAGTMLGAVENVRAAAQQWLTTNPTAHNVAKQLALEAVGKTVVVYAGPELGHAAYMWKLAFNRFARLPAWQVNYPTDVLDDLQAWSGHSAPRPYVVYQLRSSHESPVVANRFEVVNKALSGKRPHPHAIWAEGETVFEQLLWARVFGNVVAAYCAVASGVDPSDTTTLSKVQTKFIYEA